MTDIQPASKGAVVITGASTGIGRACALHMDRMGYRVFAGVRRTADGDALKAAATQRLTPIMIDVAKPEQIKAAAEQVGQALGDGPLLGLVNNAGIGKGGPLEYLPVDDIRWQFEVNVFGLMQTTQDFLPLIRRGQGGRIVNIGSIAGKVSTPFMGPYCASKFAVEALSDALRGELRPWDIQVALVEPGNIDTPIWGKATDLGEEMREALPPIAWERYGERFKTLQRMFKGAPKAGAPAEDVAKAVYHALTATRANTRYLVGKDAHAGAFLRWLLPDRAFDWVMLRVQKL